MSKAHLPPVPPASRSPKDGVAHPGATGDMADAVGQGNKESKDRNLAEQGRQGNIKQNTTHPGHQQDR